MLNFRTARTGADCVGLALVERDARGRIGFGNKLNPRGNNQHNSHRVAVNERMDAGVRKALEDNPFCVQLFADEVALALADPHSPESHRLLQLALPRIWPAILQIESRNDGDMRDAARGGADEWSGLSAEFGARLPSVADTLAGDVLDVTPESSSDTSPGTE